MSICDSQSQPSSPASIHPVSRLSGPAKRSTPPNLIPMITVDLVANAPDMDIKTLQVLARHRDIATTMKHYVRAKEEAKRRAIEGVSLGRIIGEGS
jgi:hypothetical protein